MIHYISGIIKTISNDYILVDIGNIGLMIYVPFPSYFKISEKVNLHIYMHWKQEQGPSLYGFLSPIEREVFVILISCPGVGPKIGLTVLVDLGVEALLEAIQKGNDKMLSKVSGIGAKRAEQITIQLKHKVAKFIKAGTFLPKSEGLVKWQEVSEVLSSLNYSRIEISAAMKHLSDNYSKDKFSFDQLIRHALSFLYKKSASL